MKRTLFAFLMLVFFLVWPMAGGASGPVPRTIDGCVIDGTLYSIRKDLVSERTGKRTVIAYPLKVANF